MEYKTEYKTGFARVCKARFSLQNKRRISFGGTIDLFGKICYNIYE